MVKKIVFFLTFIAVATSNAQIESLPVDFRQHNAINLNSSLLNPSYVLNGDYKNSIGLWSRWQFQTIDGDPTSLFVNYNGKLGKSSGFGVGFIQHNTGVFLQQGGALNYAYNIVFSPKVSLGVGLNVFGYMEELADDRFVTNPDINIPQAQITNDFIVQVAPGINLKVDRFNLGFTSENAFRHNFSDEESSASDDRIYLGLASYDVVLSGSNIVLSPMVYLKSIPNTDTQYGINTLVAANKFWAQAGYNSYYGVSGGLGGVFFKKWSLGVLVEYGLDETLKDLDPTFEIVTAFNFGKKASVEELDEEEEDGIEEELKENIEEELKLTRKERRALAKQEKERLQRVEDSLNLAKKQTELAKIQRDKREQEAQDALLKEQEKTRLAAIEQRKKDSLNAAALAKENEEKLAALEEAKKKAEAEKIAAAKEEVKPRKGERYKEVISTSIEPGFYLIANIYGTQKYYNAFMTTLKNKGLNPGSFRYGSNNYNYVYLERFDTMQEARKARDSKYNGRYTEMTWIFRAVPE